jgi:hypothetical protein
MYQGEKMNFELGDRVKMTKKGFKFYSNVDKQFNSHSVSNKMDSEHFTMCVCELFSVHGIGTVKHFNDEGDPYISWKYKLDGVYYYYEHFYDKKDVTKLSILDRIIFKIQGRI